MAAEKEVVSTAGILAMNFASDGKVLIFASTVKLCDNLADAIRQQGFDG